MATQIEVIKLALINLGQLDPELTSLDENTKHSRAMRIAWPICVDAVLGSRPWGFARKRVQIPKQQTGVPFGEGQRYKKPDDFIRFYRLNDCEYDYHEEGDCIVSQYGPPLDLIYVSRLANVGAWSALAVPLLATALAVETAYAITGDKGVRDDMLAIYQRKLSMTGMLDAFSDSPAEFESDIWLQARVQ